MNVDATQVIEQLLDRIKQLELEAAIARARQVAAKTPHDDTDDPPERADQ